MRLIVGAFSAYLVDAYKRKHVCILSSMGMIGATVCYYFVESYQLLLALCAIQGVFVGMATMAGVTLAIDITHTNKRSYGNLTFSWMVRLGMLAGLAFGGWLYLWSSVVLFLMVTVVFGFLCILV